MIEFAGWPKTPRLFRDITITEKIDGTNAAIHIAEYEGTEPFSHNQRELGAVATVHPLDGKPLLVGAQSRNRLIFPGADNAGFAGWVSENASELAALLGVGTHYGEWWGSGIQRGYGLTKGEKRFSLFNVHRYGKVLSPENTSEPRSLLPELGVVPVLYQGPFSHNRINHCIETLREKGSEAAPLFEGDPEGVVVYHSASRQVYKVLLENDEMPKGLAA